MKTAERIAKIEHKMKLRKLETKKTSVVQTKGNQLGLKRLRRGNNKQLLPPCENCKVQRYNPCTCMRKAKA